MGVAAPRNALDALKNAKSAHSVAETRLLLQFLAMFYHGN